MSETQAAEAAAKAPDTRPDTRQVGAGELKDLAAKLQDLLKIRTLPIGMKQFETVEAMEAIPGLRRPKPGRFHTTCQLVTKARMAGLTLGITSENVRPPANTRGVQGNDLQYGEKVHAGRMAGGGVAQN